MSETVTDPVVETPDVPVETVTTTDDAPLGAPGLAALKAEREAHAAAVAKLKEYEDRDKTEAEKLAERAAAAEKRAAELEVKALRAEVAAAKGIPVALLSGGTQEELEAHADALLNFRGGQGGKGPHAPNEGTSPTVEVSDEKKFVKSLFGNGD